MPSLTLDFRLAQERLLDGLSPIPPVKKASCLCVETQTSISHMLLIEWSSFYPKREYIFHVPVFFSVKAVHQGINCLDSRLLRG